jgi:hypothetical protein
MSWSFKNTEKPLDPKIQETLRKYGDIIDLPHYVSKTRPQMSLHGRAGQLAPFAALRGHSDAIEETARITENEVYLDESSIFLINEKLKIVRENLGQNQEVTITYFEPDQKKDGGKYVSAVGIVKKIDEIEGEVVFVDNKSVKINHILDIEL